MCTARHLCGWRFPCGIVNCYERLPCYEPSINNLFRSHCRASTFSNSLPLWKCAWRWKAYRQYLLIQHRLLWKCSHRKFVDNHFSGWRLSKEPPWWEVGGSNGKVPLYGCWSSKFLLRITHSERKHRRKPIEYRTWRYSSLDVSTNGITEALGQSKRKSAFTLEHLMSGILQINSRKTS